MKSKFIIYKGIKIEQNPLSGDWFIFAKSKKNGQDVSVYGNLKEMKKCAKFASERQTIVQY